MCICGILFFSPPLVVEGIKSVPSVCVSVSQHSAGWALWSRISKSGIGNDFEQSRSSLKVKVIGERSRSPGQKMWFSRFQMDWPVQIHFVIAHDIRWCHRVTSWRHLTSLGKITDKEGTKWDSPSRLRHFHWLRIQLSFYTQRVTSNTKWWYWYIIQLCVALYVFCKIALWGLPVGHAQSQRRWVELWRLKYWFFVKNQYR